MPALLGRPAGARDPYGGAGGSRVAGKKKPPGLVRAGGASANWYAWRDSNPRIQLRRLALYPLSYRRMRLTDPLYHETQAVASANRCAGAPP